MIDYVNMNKDFIPKETKTFVKLNSDEFMKYMKQRAIVLSEMEEFHDDIDIEEPDPNNKWGFSIPEHYAYILYGYCPIINDDLSWICMCGENFTADHVHGNSEAPTDGHLVGLHTLENGLTLVGCMDGGDWEFPFYFFFYYDGENIRAYIPSYGNTINLDSKTAFGSEGEYEGTSEEELAKMYNINLEREETDFFAMHDYTSFYLEKQGITSSENISINWDAIREEILTVFKIAF